MKYLWILLWVVCSGRLMAEGAPQGQGGGSYGGGSGYNKLNPNTINVFDNNFFDSKKEEPRPTTVNGRALADEPDYNTETRAQSLEKCASLKDRDFAKYQECYKSDMKKTKAAVKDNYEQVEQKQAIPLRNAPNALIEEAQKQNLNDEEND